MQLEEKDKEWIKDIIIDKYSDLNVVEDTDFLDSDHDIDSLDKIELNMLIEIQFDITISDEESEKIRTVEDIYELLKSK